MSSARWAGCTAGSPWSRFWGWAGPLILVKALVESYEAVPAGRAVDLSRDGQMAFAQVGRALELALRAAAPVALALALAGIILGWLSRTASSLPFVALALPIRTLVGVVLLFLGLATLFVTLSGVWETYPWGG